MDQPNNSASKPAKNQKVEKTSRLIRYSVYLALITLCLLVIVAMRFGGMQLSLDGTNHNVRAQIEDLIQRVERLEKIASTIETYPEKEENKEKEETEASWIKDSIASIEASIEELRTQTKRETESSGKSSEEMKKQLAMMVAFIQLRASLDSGGDYSGPLQDLKNIAADNGTVMAAIVRMEPFSTKGLASLAELRDEFRMLRTSVQTEMRKADAKTWKEKILAGLQELISIRSLRGAENKGDILDNINKELEKNNLTAALDKEKELPVNARRILEQWREKAEARKNVEEAMASIAKHFMISIKTEE